MTDTSTSRATRTRPPWGAIVFLLIFVFTFIGVAIDYAHIKPECDREHGILVRGGEWLTETGFSGYICIEKGQH